MPEGEALVNVLLYHAAGEARYARTLVDGEDLTMANGEFDFGFAVDWMRKDLGIVIDEASRNGARLPLTVLVDQFYAQVQARGGERWDTSSLIDLLTNP